MKPKRVTAVKWAAILSLTMACAPPRARAQEGAPLPGLPGAAEFVSGFQSGNWSAFRPRLAMCPEESPWKDSVFTALESLDLDDEAYAWISTDWIAGVHRCEDDRVDAWYRRQLAVRTGEFSSGRLTRILMGDPSSANLAAIRGAAYDLNRTKEERVRVLQGMFSGLAAPARLEEFVRATNEPDTPAEYWRSARHILLFSTLEQDPDGIVRTLLRMTREPLVHNRQAELLEAIALAAMNRQDLRSETVASVRSELADLSSAGESPLADTARRVLARWK